VAWAEPRSLADGLEAFVGQRADAISKPPKQEKSDFSIRPPKPVGLGTQLIQRALEFELDGTTELTSESGGLRLKASFPAA
jgi:hypothetical protein